MNSFTSKSSLADINHDIGFFERLPSHVRDLRNTPPDVFEDVSYTDWPNLSWEDVDRPYKVDKWAKGKKMWEEEHGERMPVKEGWKHFNKSFHSLFIKDVPKEKQQARSDIWKHLMQLDIHGAGEALEELIQLLVWTKVHRVEDAIWSAPTDNREGRRPVSFPAPRMRVAAGTSR